MDTGWEQWMDRCIDEWMMEAINGLLSRNNGQMNWINGLYYCTVVCVLFVEIVINIIISSYCSSAILIQLYLYNYTTLLQLLVMLVAEYEIISKKVQHYYKPDIFPLQTYMCCVRKLMFQNNYLMLYHLHYNKIERKWGLLSLCFLYFLSNLYKCIISFYIHIINSCIFPTTYEDILSLHK